MRLELLANELLLDIFGYFPAVQLLRTFHRLNTRFDNLIFVHFRTYRLDFRAVAKKDFDTVCQMNLPWITDRIVSLALSNDDETCQQIDLFYSFGWNFNQFQYLRSLSLDHIRFVETLRNISLECYHLTHLTLTACSFRGKQDDILRFVNSIWCLPKLIYCSLNSTYPMSIPIPTSISLSLEHLSMVGFTCTIDKFIHLFVHTLRLRYFASQLNGSHHKKALKTSILSMTELNLTYNSSQRREIRSLLQHVPNLCRLKIETMSVEMNGYEWEEIIRNHLPKLKKFQLNMKVQVDQNHTRKNLLNSFRTRFWLEEHQWFVRYHHNSADLYNSAYIYTLPYSFTHLDVIFPVHFESTCPNDNDYSSYDHVQHLIYHSSSVKQEITFDLNFPKITSLSITLPVNNHLLSIVQRCGRLTSLKVAQLKKMSNDDTLAQLEALLDHAPHVHSLRFNSWLVTRPYYQNFTKVEKVIPIVLRSPSMC